ncbi:MAG: hypothetical protein PHD95_01205 [Candidatus ainarchaeum sp.]|nr:hypothetical protein [Candidatus ainarchaeum sp.]
MKFDDFTDRVISDFAKLSAKNKQSGWTSWPAEAWHIEHFGATAQRKMAYGKINTLLAQGKTIEEIGRMFFMPSRLLYLGLLPGRKSDSILRVEERKKFAELAYSIYKTMKQTPYNRNGKNAVFSEKQVVSIIDGKIPTLDGKACEEKLKSLHLDFFALVETVYGYRRVNGCEIHGLYETKKGRFVVMDLFDFDSPFLEATRELWFKKVSLIEKIAKSFEISIDNFQHVNCKGNWPKSVKQLYCIVDGKLLPHKEINSFCARISEITQNAIGEMQKLSYKQRIEIMLKNYFWTFRELFAAAGGSYLPEDKFFEKVRTAPLPKDLQPIETLQKLTFAEIFEILKKKFDPRV